MPCFSTIAYAQLVAENCLAAQVAASTISVIFHGLIEELSEGSLKLAAKFPPGSTQRGALKGAVRVPRTDHADLEAVSESIAAGCGASAVADAHRPLLLPLRRVRSRELSLRFVACERLEPR
jgi:hypothetical protein